MVFSSTTFLFLFLPIVLIAYYNPIFKSLPFKNAVLIVSSIFFYAWGEPVYVLLMLGSILINWALGLAETGEIINIDGAGNRVASTLYGHEKIYYIVGRNKLAKTYDDALWRARNIASPKNARKLGRKTPCAVNADKCYDCKSPDRICRGLVVMWEPMMNMEAEVILIDEELGF